MLAQLVCLLSARLYKGAILLERITSKGTASCSSRELGKRHREKERGGVRLFEIQLRIWNLIEVQIGTGTGNGNGGGTETAM